MTPAMHRPRPVYSRMLAVLLLGLAGCSDHESAVPAQPLQTNASATATLGGASLQASTMAVTDLNDAVAERYAIDRSSPGVLVLVTIRDTEGNGIAPGDLQVEATAGSLTEAPTPLALHAITTGGMTDYIGVFSASPPATVQFRINAVRNGARADIMTTAELYPR